MIIVFLISDIQYEAVEEQKFNSYES